MDMAISRKEVLTCPIERTLACLGARYKARIIYQLMQAPRRYAQLRDSVPEISERMLNVQLRQLQADQIVRAVKRDLDGATLRYCLTPRGEQLRPVFAAMLHWGRDADLRPAANGKISQENG